jgi:hypothetical protein
LSKVEKEQSLQQQPKGGEICSCLFPPRIVQCLPYAESWLTKSLQKTALTESIIALIKTLVYYGILILAGAAAVARRLQKIWTTDRVVRN